MLLEIHVFFYDQDNQQFPILQKLYKINMTIEPKNNYYDLILVAVKHDIFRKIGIKRIRSFCNSHGFIYDLKSMFNYNDVDFSL